MRRLSAVGCHQDAQFHWSDEELQRRKTALRKASSSGVLLGVPEEESADAEAAEEEADGADAPVRAVLQDALEESDEEVLQG